MEPREDPEDQTDYIDALYQRIQADNTNEAFVRKGETIRRAEPNYGAFESVASWDSRRRDIHFGLQNPISHIKDNKVLKRRLRKEIRLYPAFAEHIGYTFVYKHIYGEDPLAETPEEAKAQKIAKQLADKYAVSVEIVATNEGYFSNSLLITALAQRGTYCISQEDPDGTAKITDLLIRRDRIRDQVLRQSITQSDTPDTSDEAALSLANQKLSEKVTQAARRVGQEIENVKAGYRKTHNGEEPNLSKIAAILNERKVDSPSGKPKKWVAEMVKRALNRYNSLPDK